MTSRLDRLFVLLESGTSSVTRRAAARQLGEVQRAHPHELQRLLARLAAHLRSPAWETRRAASQAVEAILANVPEWNPEPIHERIEECGGLECEDERESGQLQCSTFDLERVLTHGAHLMGSEGNEYDHDEQTSSATPDLKDKITRQRQQLNARLGLDMASKLGMDLSEVYTNEDLMCAASPSAPTKAEPTRRPVPELILSAMLPLGSLSSRERNRARRMARHALLCKQRSRDASADEEAAAGAPSAPSAPTTPRTPRTPHTPDEPDRKRLKLDPSDDVFFPEECCISGDGAWSAGCARWPLEGWACAVSGALFVAAWEARHGAASALRELLRARVAGGAGKRRGQTRRQMENAHQDWLEDMALRLLCVLALDRFGDFVSDQVVAPVRETCAQALGVALSRLEAARVHGVAALLAQLARQPQWEARHGALLGFKYLIASREELACSTGAFTQLMAGLSDGVEDVGAVAAGALAPAAAALLRARPDALRPVLARLWQLLREQDDLAAACNSYMALLAALLSHPRAAAQLHPIDLSDVLPRLWPYLDHSTSSVRKATLQTLRTLTRPLTLSCKSNGEEDSSNGIGNEEPIKCQAEEKNGVIDEINIKTEEKTNGEKEELIIKKEKIDLEDENNIKKEENHGENKEIDVKNVNNIIKAQEANIKKEEIDTKDKVKNTEDEYMQWTPELLADAMRFIYQRVLFEHVHEIQEIAEQVWNNLLQHSRLQTLLMAACPLLSMWLCLAMQPPRQSVDPLLLLQPPPLKERRQRGASQAEAVGTGGPAAEGVRPPQKWFVGGGESAPLALRERNVTRARCLAAAMLGQLSCYIVLPAPDVDYKTEDESPINCYAKVLVVYLRSGSALQRLVAALVLSAWAQRSAASASTRTPTPALLTDALHAALTHTIYYDEVAHSCTRILQEARDLTAMMRHYQLPVDGDEFSNIMRLNQVTTITTLMQPMIANMKQKRVAPQLEERRKCLQSAATQCLADHNSYNVSVLGALASAGVWLGALPERLNPLVKPLMESLRREPSPELQRGAARALPELLARCRERAVSPAAKVLANLKAYLRCDPEHTPRAALDATEEPSDSGSNESGAEAGRHAPHDAHNPVDRHRGILTLWEQQRAAERGSSRRASAAGGRPPGRPPAPSPPAPPTAATADLALDALFPHEDEAQKLLRIQRRGATLAFTNLAEYFGDDLPRQLPKLWEFIVEPFSQHITDKVLESQGCAETDELISCMQVLEVVCGSLSAELRRELARRTGALARLTRHHYTAARHMAARCLAALAVHEPACLMQLYIDEVVPALGMVGEERVRCGAAEALARAVDALQLQVVPYIVLLVVPLLGRMSDHCEPVRLMSTRCFASLIQLMPLDGAVPEPAGISAELRARKAHDRRFLEQLFNPKSIEDYKIPIPVAAELRSYQQAGVNWLRFLQQYKLHGVLCDDMGLGKTLQSIVVVAGAHWERAQLYAATRAPEHAALPSLVVCPPTLTGHWVYEVKKFISKKYLNPLQYMGPPSEREKLRAHVKRHDLIVASYDIVRKDIDFFSAIKWHYCILDEGHIIKNGKTKAFKAIKMLVANHRLILSGTPIQNNVLELWSLFDFLMPGLLGTERQFTARYSRAILAARDARATPHHQQAGARAMEALHRQVLPFLLRRVKEDVLQELPPKITQDYYCELSPLQRRLYEDFSRAHLPAALVATGPTSSSAAAAGPVGNAKSHVFQALRYLQNVCNHPKLVLTEEHPEGARVRRDLAAQQSSLQDIQHSAKLPALKQLLQDCGIGVSAGGGGSGGSGDGAAGVGGAAEQVVSQHRALIFCQLKAMLDIVERDLLRAHLPSVSYLRLDGSVAPGARHALVHTFNSDPSIDVLLLTTKVGGLGLNLTGADTVIFVEHDWNPMRDLQAMDRAHRIGQRRVVNVYRLITRNTLEEKIMGLQKFKLLTANTVISNENAALETMGTEQLLDLFHLASDSPGVGVGAGATPTPAHPAALHALPELWDDKQYEEEYDMTCFIQSLNKKSTPPTLSQRP